MRYYPSSLPPDAEPVFARLLRQPRVEKSPSISPLELLVNWVCRCLCKDVGCSYNSGPYRYNGPSLRDRPRKDGWRIQQPPSFRPCRPHSCGRPDRQWRTCISKSSHRLETLPMVQVPQTRFEPPQSSRQRFLFLRRHQRIARTTQTKPPLLPVTSS